MICRIGDVVRCGASVTVGIDVPPTAVATAVREGNCEVSGRTIAVAAPSPSPAHEKVGCIEPGMGLRTRTALAAAARSRGLSTPVDDELAETRARLRELEIESESLEPCRREVAAAEDRIQDLREEVATARGRLAACRDRDLPTEAARAELEHAIERLSEAETEATAAGQAYDRKRAATRDRRDRRDRRFRLEDRVANLEREARSHLLDRVRPEYERTVTATPGCPAHEDPFAVDPVTRALAVVRVGDLSAPVVLGCDRFESPAEAAGWLGAPVIHVNAPQAGDRVTA